MRVINRRFNERFFHGLIVLLLVLALFGQPAPASAAGTTINVNTSVDEYNESNNNCSLREAIVAANQNRVVGTGSAACAAGAQNEIDVIVVPAGDYILTLPQTTGEDAQSGDLDILTDMIIQGAGIGKTKIISTIEDRVFHIGEQSATAGTVRLAGLEIWGGKALKNNRTEGRGGGIFVENGDVQLWNVLLQDNKAFFTGGAIDNNIVSTLTLYSTTVIDNEANEGGGIYNLGNLFVYQSAILDNTAVVTGGGMDSRTPESGTVTLTNVTIGGNTAGPSGGGGIYTDGPLNINSSTITQNAGAGLRVLPTSTVRVRNTIIAGQKDGQPNCSFAQDNPKYQSLGYNLEDLNTCDFTKTGDMRQKSLAEIGLETTRTKQGGPTELYALLETSIAIDPVILPEPVKPRECPGVDQRWSVRPVDGNDADAIAQCDIGAFEYGPFTQLKLFMPTVRR